MQSHKSELNKEEKEISSKTLTLGLFAGHIPLNKKIIFFITNPSEDKSKGSSLYFVSQHGVIRCRSDHTGDRPPQVAINPYMTGYYEPGEQKKEITILEPAVGLFPFEAERAIDLASLNRMKKKGRKGRHYHYGHSITEIISLEQFNDPQFMPETWVNSDKVGILWSSAVNKIKEAKEMAILNIHGHYARRDILIPVPRKKLAGCGCTIS